MECHAYKVEEKSLQYFFLHIFFNDGKPIIFVFVTINQSDSYK